jgi:hypothetical protein
MIFRAKHNSEAKQEGLWVKLELIVKEILEEMCYYDRLGDRENVLRNAGRRE